MSCTRCLAAFVSVVTIFAPPPAVADDALERILLSSWELWSVREAQLTDNRAAEVIRLRRRELFPTLTWESSVESALGTSGEFCPDLTHDFSLSQALPWGGNLSLSTLGLTSYNGTDPDSVFRRRLEFSFSATHPVPGNSSRPFGELDCARLAAALTSRQLLLARLSAALETTNRYTALLSATAFRDFCTTEAIVEDLRLRYARDLEENDQLERRDLRSIVDRNARARAALIEANLTVESARYNLNSATPAQLVAPGTSPPFPIVEASRAAAAQSEAVTIPGTGEIEALLVNRTLAVSRLSYSPVLSWSMTFYIDERTTMDWLSSIDHLFRDPEYSGWTGSASVTVPLTSSRHQLRITALDYHLDSIDDRELHRALCRQVDAERLSISTRLQYRNTMLALHERCEEEYGMSVDSVASGAATYAEQLDARLRLATQQYEHRLADIALWKAVATVEAAHTILSGTYR